MGVETLAIAAFAGGTALNVYGAVQQGKTQEAASRFNASIAERNAKALERQKRQVDRATALDIKRCRNNFNDLNAASSMSVRYNGGQADSGTGRAIALANASEADEEIAIMRYNTEVQKMQLQEGADQSRMQARLQRMYGTAAKRAGYISAGASLLKSAGTIASMGQTPTGGPAPTGGPTPAGGPTF